jgi:putative tricarboxylic transport membrane protein
MELFDNLAFGFSVALSPTTLLYCFIGVTFGTFIGVLPGIGPLATIGLLLPITFHLSPIEGIVMLAGIYYGALYGGSTTAILLNLPGTAASVVVALDGHPMAKAGRPGPPLVMTTLVSFFAACVAIIIISAFAPPLARFALRFQSPEYFSLMVMGLLGAAALVHGSLLKGLAMVVLGLLLGMVGLDLTTGLERYTFGSLHLVDGLSFVVVIIGLIGLAEVLNNLALGADRPTFNRRIGWRELVPSREDLKLSIMPTLRGTALGSALGILPGAGAAISSFAAYAVEKRVSRTPERFGKGAMEGVTAPEAANNAAAQTSFIPTLSIGIPGDAVMALILGAMMIHGLVPGPRILQTNPDFFWGLIASFWIGNLLLLILNLPLVGIWVRLLATPYHIMFPAILTFIAVGVYSLHASLFDVLLVTGLGAAGYLFLKLRCEAAPLLLGLILGPLLEQNLRRSMLLSRGDPTIFLTRPISLFFLTLGVLIILLVAIPHLKAWWRKRFRPAAVEGAE